MANVARESWAPSAPRDVERALQDILADAAPASAPPTLARALHYAVFPGGGRLRPALCLAAARACDASSFELAIHAAVAVELVHCASLAHDDLPCFDDASVRRGKPSVHAAFGEPLAVLAGDALIVLAFEALARGARAAGNRAGDRLADLVLWLARATGPARGLIAGQAWESEPSPSVSEYHRAKTGALFEAAAAMGAIAAGGAPGPWSQFGDRVGRAYQAIDDLADATGVATALGKPVGRDAALDRPSMARTEGHARTRAAARALLDEAMRVLPPGRARQEAAEWVATFSVRALRAVAL